MPSLSDLPKGFSKIFPKALLKLALEDGRCKGFKKATMKRNKIGSFVEMWMDLETVIQTEVRKRNINIY